MEEVAGGRLNVPVANPVPKCPKPRKLVGDLAASPGEGFSGFSDLRIGELYVHFWEGSQTTLERLAGWGFNQGTLPTRWGTQLNGNFSSVISLITPDTASPLAGEPN